jgi:alanine racemase
MARPNQARLNLAALRHNIEHARALAPQSKVMAVVKANAYGHGAVTIAKALQDHADALAVACIEEAQELRTAGITAPILLLEGFFQEDEIAQASRDNFWLCIDSEWQLSALERAELQQPVHVWLKIDTGMHRLGIHTTDAGNAHKRLKAALTSRTTLFCAPTSRPQTTWTARRPNNRLMNLIGHAKHCRGSAAPRILQAY